MRIEDLSAKSVCIIGFGREGQAMAEALEKHAPRCRITVAEKNQEPFGFSQGESRIKNQEYEFQLGENYLDKLERFDVLIKSPGIPPHSQLKAQSTKLTSPTQIFFDTIKDSGATVIGITGSKGKSTTSSLIHAILKKAGKESYLIGNIGMPAIGFIDKAKPNTFFVHEMSSYQLMDLNCSPQIAVITAFFPEHLDYHGSLDNYFLAKKNITLFQNEDCSVFFNTKSEECQKIAAHGKGKKIPFSDDDSPVTIEETKLLGRHNLSNIAGAYKVAMSIGIPEKTAIEAISEFEGLPHRLQFIGEKDGCAWIDDSISTTPESAIAALEALGNRVRIIILGGQDRGYDFSLLAERISKSKIETVILLPDSGRTIRQSIEKAGIKVNCVEVETMEEAVSTAKKMSQSSKLIAHSFPIVLLSPASPSYGHFKNFEERGDQFKNTALSVITHELAE